MRLSSQSLRAILGVGVWSAAYLDGMLGMVIYSANGGNISKTFEIVAESLTNAIRSGPQALDHHGTVYRTEVIMRVDWEWLAYPTSLLFLVSLLC